MMNTWHRTIAQVLLLIFLTGLSACSGDDTKVRRKKRRTATNSDSEEIEIKALRLERDFFACTRENFSRDTILLRKKYGLFLDRYCADIIQVGTKPLNCESILGFTNYPNFKKVSLEVDKQYKDISLIEEELQSAFTLFSDEFPDTLVPKVITMFSGFNYCQANTDSVLAISLEMYLGESCSFYEALNYPDYKKKRTNKNYLVPDAMRGFLTCTFPSENQHNDLISKMIYDGKILFLLKRILPNRKEHECIGYTEKQWQNNEENEANIWSHFVDKKLFYSKDFNDQVNYLNDGPFTPGFSKETPPKMGAWLGYKIVSSYMENNPKTSLEKLIYLKDAHQIFQKSGYKPPRQ